MSDDSLHQQTIHLAGLERKYAREVLLHLREVERRMVYAARGYGSLFEYCTKELRYSEAAAGRRVRASRLLRDVPEISVQIESGALNISNLAQAQSFIRHEEKRTGEKISVDAKRELMQKIESKTQDQAKRILIDTFPDLPVIHERKRDLPNGAAAVTMIFSERLRQKLNRVKELTSHQNDNPSWNDLVEKLADEFLKKNDPEIKIPTRCLAAEAATASDRTSHRKPIRVAIKHEIYKRAQSRCEHIDATSGRRCERRFHLQIDHVLPLARGGTNELSNLQLLCRAHNVWKGSSPPSARSFEACN